MKIINIIKIFSKKQIIFVSSIILFLLILIFLYLFYPKIKVENPLKKLGKEYYENYYYIQLDDSYELRKEFLSNYKDSGLKINLNTLRNYKDISSKRYKNCNWDKTMIIVYPEEPYKVNNYRVEVELDCN